MRIQKRESTQILSPEYRKEKFVAPYTACSLPQSLQSNSHLGEREQTEGCSHNPDLIRRWVRRMAVWGKLGCIWITCPAGLAARFSRLKILRFEVFCTYPWFEDGQNIFVWFEGIKTLMKMYLCDSRARPWWEYICVIWGLQDLGEDVFVWL